MGVRRLDRHDTSVDWEPNVRPEPERIRKRRRRSRRRLRRTVLITGLGLGGTAAFAVIAIARLPFAEPALPTRERYAALMDNRAVRQDIRGEPAVASVRDRATAPPAVAPSVVSAVERVRISRIGVNAPVIEMGVRPDGAMDSPDSPDLVAWYGFSGTPGLPGNAVFSGHVDFHDHGPAVFWELKALESGDVVDIELEDGTFRSFAVTAALRYPAATIPMAEILAQTPVPTITLITCAGSFRDGHYSDLLVIRAVSTSTLR